jgi:N-acetylmuramoyl-L-alanine amidase
MRGLVRAVRTTFFIAAITLPSLVWAKEGPRIILDPGHGGSQEGAMSPAGFKEKTLALNLALLVKAALERELGARVLLTRTDDSLIHLSERVAFVRRQQPDLFISIHANSMPTARQRKRLQGIETFFLSARASGTEARKTADRENAEQGRSPRGKAADPLSLILADLMRTEAHVDSSRLAYAVHQSLIRASGAEDRGVQQAPFYVLMGIEVPSILVEIGFISHPRESVKLQDRHYQRALAQAMAEGVRRFFTPMQAREAHRAGLSEAPNGRGSP